MSEAPNQDSDLRQLRERLDYLEAQLHRQTARIYELERRLGVSAASHRSTVPADPPSPPNQTVRPRREWPALAKMAHLDWERVVGGNWFNRIGILAIILAVGFFFKHAIENDWLGPLGRVVLGVVTGFTFLIGGERIRQRGYRFYAHGLAGGGICILYLSIYAAHDRYQLIGQLTAAFLLTIITVIAVALATRYDALAIAILGLICGFLTPLLLAGREDNQIALFGYMTLLNLGVLGIAWARRWRALNYLAFLATTLLSYIWWDEWYQPSKLALTVVVLTILYLIFALTGVIGSLVRQEPARELDLLLILLNGAVYFGALFALLNPEHRGALSGGAVLLALFYVAQSLSVRRWGGEDHYLSLALRGLAMTFLTVAIPIRFNLAWVTISWAVEGAMLTWLGVRTGRRLTRVAAAIVLGLATLHWFQADLPGLSPAIGASFIFLLNWRGMAIFAIILALLVSAALYRRTDAAIAPAERARWSGGMALGAALLLVAWVSFDQWDCYRLLLAPLRQRDDALTAIKRLQNWSHFFLGSWWAFSGMAILAAGIRRQTFAARLPGLFLLFLAGVVALAAGFSFHGEEWHTLLVNPTFGLFLFFAATLAVGYREYRRAGTLAIPREVAILSRTMLSLANLSLLTGLSLELDGYFDRHAGLGTDGLIEQLGQSMLYAVYGAVMIAAGAWRANRQIRLLGLLILGLTTLKVFLFDLASLEQIYRVIAFVGLGLILLLVSWHYQRRSGS